jgi:hypothetical protein
MAAPGKEQTMSKHAHSVALAGLMSLAAATAFTGDEPAAPAGTIDVTAGGESLTLWPYTSADFATPSDPVNLIFPNADPRAIRQELLKLDGNRPPFAAVPGGNCTWTDAMGYEQAAYGDPEGWVGGAVQLACVTPSAPLGSPFRFHIRLFRQGDHTLGNAHFEFLIPGTAEHEVLSWDLAREFVTFDMARTGVLTAAPSAVGLIPAGTFRTVRRPVYLGLVQAGAGPLLASLGFVLPASGDVPIPTSGQARVLVGEIDFQPYQSKATTTTRVTYSIVVPKPFCATGPGDFVKLEGPLDFSMTVHTNPSGRYDRTYLIGGTLRVTPMTPTSPTTFVPVGDPVDVVVFEAHRGALTEHRGQVTEDASRVLFGEPRQSLSWRFAAGHTDHFARQVLCGAE